MTDLFSFDFGAPAPPPLPPKADLGEAQSGASPAAGGPDREAGGHAAPQAALSASVAAAVQSAGGPRLHDGECLYVVGGNRNMLVPWYLIASWAYYVCDSPLISDGLFDRLCRELEAEFDQVEHQHKPLVDRGWLPAGTCGLAREAYPVTVRGAAAHLAAGDGVLLPRS